MFKNFKEVPISEGHAPPAYPMQVPHYVLLLCQGDVDPDWQWEIAKWIVHSTAVIAAAWGPHTTKWDDAIDGPLIHEQDQGRVDQERFVITTWHDDEPIEDTLDYLIPAPPCNGLLVLNAENTSVPMGEISDLLGI